MITGGNFNTIFLIFMYKYRLYIYIRLDLSSHFRTMNMMVIKIENPQPEIDTISNLIRARCLSFVSILSEQFQLEFHFLVFFLSSFCSQLILLTKKYN